MVKDGPRTRAATMFSAALVTVVTGAALLLTGCRGDADHRAPRAAAIVFRSVPGEPGYGAVDVTPLDARSLDGLSRAVPTPAQWREIFSVWSGDSTGLPMFGEYSLQQGGVRFTPRYPPSGGSVYIARFSADRSNALSGGHLPRGSATGIWSLSAGMGPATTYVDAVYPSTDSVPMNLLRMYIHFSAPMSVGQLAARVHLVDERGNGVPDAFLIPSGGEELWDPGHQRLTLLFDPGRIKRDLRPHEEKGLPLREGHRYRLMIDSAWHDAYGHALVRPFEKRLDVGPVDRALPRAESWRLTPPRAGTRDPLRVVFPEPLDHALLERMLVVHRGAGSAVAGLVSVTGGDREWRFAPARPWSPDAHYLEIDSKLEDLAGNNLRRLFDVMPGDVAAYGVTADHVRLPFTPGK